MNTLPNLFRSLEIKNKRIKNRIVSTAHGDGVSNGLISENLIRYYERKAKGGAGLIIAFGSASVYSKASNPAYVSLWDKRNENKLKDFSDRIHKHGAILLAQATHQGSRHISSGEPLQAPSSISDWLNREVPMALSKDEIQNIVHAYTDAAIKLEKNGFDGIEITSLGGHLIEQFWSPVLNKRNDEYGGNLDGRMRFSLEVVNSISKVVSKNFIISFRMSGDPMTDVLGLYKNDMINIAKKLDSINCIDIFNIGGGTGATLDAQSKTIPPDSYPDRYFSRLTKEIKTHLSVPVLAAGRMVKPIHAEQSLEEQSCDLVGMTRAMIADPNMPNLAYEGKEKQIRPCTGTNQGCIGRTSVGLSLGCIVNAGVSNDELHDYKKTTEVKRISVIGGGPAGMEASRVLAERGHEVSLFEAKSRLGGQVVYGELHPDREHFGGHVHWLSNELHRLSVDIHYNMEITADTVVNKDTHCIVLATGAKAVVPPPIYDIDSSFITDVEALNADYSLFNEKNVFVYDPKGLRGSYVSYLIKKHGAKNVELATLGETVLDNVDKTNKPNLYKRLAEYNIRCTPNKRLIQTKSNTTIELQDIWSETQRRLSEFDIHVFAGYSIPKTDLKNSFPNQIPVYMIGDCVSPRSIYDAVREGVKLGNEIGSGENLNPVQF